MTIIYEPKGRAGEYCKLAANLYRGCGHGCKYCYAPGALRMNPASFHEDPVPRKDVIQKLEKQLKKQSFTGPVLLCFSCDPYQPINDDHDLTGQAIRLLKKHNLNIEILTKGGARVEKDLKKMESWDRLGVTLTFINNADSLEWEPEAAPPEKRIALLKKAKQLGIKTWVSLEPVIDPAQTFEIIRQTHDFVDLFKVGKLNYHPHAKTINWRNFTIRIVELLNNYNWTKPLTRW